MSPKKRNLRIGCVPYLNARPLVETLEHPILYKPPSRLHALLARGSIDVGLLPAIEFFRHDYARVPGVSIASDGAVETVRLHLRRPPKQVRSCALDRNSGTSNALTRIVLEEFYGARPDYTMWDPRNRLPKVDAALIIGDNSFRAKGKSIDLGTIWKKFTGLPFVYALWVYPRAHPQRLLIRRTLRQAMREGLPMRKEIARREAKRLGLDPRLCLRYLTRNIRFELGPRERAGLARFRRSCAQLNLI